MFRYFIQKSEQKKIALIRKSGLVLGNWYQRYYQDLTGSAVDPIEHYFLFGWKEGRRPNPYFDTSWYRNEHQISSEECPLLHYIKNKEAFDPCPFFNVKKYREFNPKIKNPLKHYIQHGFKNPDIMRIELLDNIQRQFQIEESGLFDFNWYKSIRPDLSGSNINLVEHYACFGWKEGSRPNKYFDPVEYGNVAKILDKDVEPLSHYIKTGWKSGLSPSREFDSKRYLNAYPDVQSANIDPLFHYLNYGEAENRSVFSAIPDGDAGEIIESGLFLDDWYLAVNEDLRGSGINPLEHFMHFGWKENRKPNPYFDMAWYSKNYQEYFENNDKLNPLLHYIRFGRLFDFNPSIDFNGKKYKQDYLSEDQEPLKHYLEEGKKEGNKVYKVNEKAKSDGGWLKNTANAKLIEDPALRAMVDYDEKPLKPKSNKYNSSNLNIHWVMPDFAAGAGGHMTIFRTIRFLEIFGHTNTIWIYNPTVHESEDQAYCDIVKHFQLIKAQVKFIDDNFDSVSGDAIFATDWGSVSFVKSATDFKRRFYFVQDHEPEFYPQGSYALAAKLSYENDLDCICASPWLKQLMENQYGRWADYFWLSVDQSIYYPPVDRVKNERCKIAFYARSFTARRAVELGFLALEALAKTGMDFEVHCFGAPLPFNEAPFDCYDHGILSPEELADLYQQCDLGIVFSATNYSLIPQEMMACGLALAELDVESTQAIFPKDVVTLLSPDPGKMAKQLTSLVSNKEHRERQARNALKWVSQFSWESSAKRVESAIIQRFKNLKFKEKKVSTNKKVVKVSVIIPTWNAGELFKTVIAKLEQQIAPWNYEIVVVDSGSSDGTVEFLQQRRSVKLHKIDNSEFQHGRTRNLAISLTSGEYIAVITQDALPVDNYWLYNLVSSLEHYPEAAGAFGRHYAWPDADPFTKRDLQNHFDGFRNFPLCVSKYTDAQKWESGDLGWQQMLHYYSDNNSCMKRSVWEKIPYPEIEFGEDQAWAWEIIKAGYGKVYAEKASLYHSHDFGVEETMKRAREEAVFFKKHFNYTLCSNDQKIKVVDLLNDVDVSWGGDNKVDESVVERRLINNAAKVSGYCIS